MGKQMFHKGDHVRVAKDLGRHMSHFENDCEAIVIGSYRDQYGGDDKESYTLHIKDHGRTSWYYGHQLTLIQRGAYDLLDQWEKEEEEEEETESNLDWIFANGKKVAENPSGFSLAALAECMGCDNLWGSAGEGITYYNNSIALMSHAEKYLIAGDKNGWLKHCKKYKASVKEQEKG